MIRFLFSILLILISVDTYSQYFSLTKKNINEFNAQIKKLEKSYVKSEPIFLKSITQASAHYFEIQTKSPQSFIKSLAVAENFDQLTNKFPNLLIDKDLLIIKHTQSNYKGEKEIEIASFEIENTSRHAIRFKYSDSLSNDNLAFFYSTYTDKYITTIRGFYLKTKFVSINIPDKYANYINYSDFLIQPEKQIFFNKPIKAFNIKTNNNNVIDSLIEYFNIRGKNPKYMAIEDQQLSINRLDNWNKKRHLLADSLYKRDTKFKQLLLSALSFAEKNSITNEDLEDIAYSTVPKNRVLNLLRQSETVGTCSFDDRPLEQLKRIATLAAETNNWNLFIQSTLNVLNDNVSRVAQSNIASNNRKTYIEELLKLDLNLNMILLGSNFKVKDSANSHYFSDGTKIAQAYQTLDNRHQDTFEKTITEILETADIDAFNKLHFYNTYLSFKNLLTDSIKSSRIDKSIKKLILHLPFEIKSRIENPNKSLTDMLHNESQLLSKFEILSSSIGSIYSYNYGGMCWKAQIKEKDTSCKIVYDLTMPINEVIAPLKNFTLKMDSLKTTVLNSDFLMKTLNSQLKSQLHIEFTNDKSFTNHNNYTTKKMPIELLKQLDFNNAISLYINDSNNKYVRYVLFENKQVLSVKSSIDINVQDVYNLYNDKGDKIY